MGSGGRFGWTRVLTIIISTTALVLPVGSSADSASTDAQTGQIILADPPKELNAVRRDGDFRLDGQLDEPFWQEAPIARGMRQRWPKEGEAASESTWVRIAYDDEALFVGIICFDSRPDQVRRRLTRRDRYTEADYVQVSIDSYHDHQTAYSFSVNASGVQLDKYIYNNNWNDDSWDAVWESKVADDPMGWTVEMRIPYHCLRFPESPEHTWGVDFIRYISRNNETDTWQFVPRSEAYGVSRYSVLKGISAITPPRHVSLLPYSVGKVKTDPKTAGNPDGRKGFGDVGADFKWAITPNMILDATANPDFGQVEADETVLNLSRFETQYPEKRPFFLEGLQLFDTDFGLFYSRRVGGSPRSPDADGDDITDRPENVTIHYAGKLSGKTNRGTSYLVLNALTADEFARYLGPADADGRRPELREPIAERGVANVARVKQDILGNSSVGLMMTQLVRHQHDPSHTGGLDWNLKTRNGTYNVRGQVVGSAPADGPQGWGWRMYLEKLAGRHVMGTFGLDYRDRALNLNELGYLGRNDYQEIFSWAQYRTEKSFGPVSRSWHNINDWAQWNQDGQRLALGGNYNNSFEFKNKWWAGFGHAREASRMDDLEIGDGTVIRIPDGFDTWVWFETDSRKPVQFSFNYSWGTLRDGGYNDYSPWIQFHPATNLEISLSPAYNIGYNSTRYVEDITADDETVIGHLFAEQNVERFSARTRGTATFTTNLSLQFYGEVFVADVHYDNFKRLVGTDGYEPYPAGPQENPDFSLLSFNANVVARWEYRPGSTIFVVWTQARDEFDELPSFTFRRGVDRLFQLPSSNVFMVKMNYWWNL